MSEEKKTGEAKKARNARKAIRLDDLAPASDVKGGASAPRVFGAGAGASAEEGKPKKRE